MQTNYSPVTDAFPLNWFIKDDFLQKKGGEKHYVFSTIALAQTEG